jgi:hypothetical protein
MLKKKLFNILLLDQAKIYWDADQTFLNDPYHDAGFFLRRFKSNWKHYKSNPFEWIVDDFSQTKTFRLLVHKTIGQAKITGTLMKIINVNPTASLDKVAVVWVRKCFGAAIVFVAIYRGALEYYDGLFKQKQSSTNFDC